MNFNFHSPPSDKEDYYKILQVTRESSSEDIKKAYRKLSMLHHPDKNGNSEESTTQFKLISEAYETLGDPDKKKLYDMGIRGDNGITFGEFEQVNPFDIFNMIFGGSMNANNPHPPHMHPPHMHPPHIHPPHMHPSFIRMGGGGMGGIHIINQGGMGMGIPQHPLFHHLQQQQQQQQQQQHFFYDTAQPPQPQQSCEPITKNIHITLENAYAGIENFSLNLSKSENTPHFITVCIPPGVNHQEVLFVSDNKSAFSQIHIIVNVEEHSVFKRNNMDLILEKEISLKESLCGLDFTIKHINGKSFNLQHKDGTIIQNNTIKTIPNLGMIGKNKQVGNLTIIFKVAYPDKLTPEQIEILSTSL